jgi:hypothetical protein
MDGGTFCLLWFRLQRWLSRLAASFAAAAAADHMAWDMDDMAAVMFVPVVFCLHMLLICLGVFSCEGWWAGPDRGRGQGLTSATDSSSRQQQPTAAADSSTAVTAQLYQQ